jgi:hypothetical protein
MTHVWPFFAITAVSFFLHLTWERLHIVLYKGYEALEGVLPVYLHAALGDVMYTLLAIGFMTLLCGTRIFHAPLSRDYALLAFLGLCIAIFVEVKADMFGRWEYTDAMPLIYGLGLSPLLQMTVLLPLSVYIVVRLEKWFNTRI